MPHSFLKVNQKGQVILFVVVAMVIALGLGIAVSARTITSLSRVSDTDTSARVLAAAEGGAERMLQKNFVELEALLTSGDCDTLTELESTDPTAVADAKAKGCLVTFEYSPTLSSRAYVTVNYMPKTPQVKFANLTMADVKEVRLDTTENTNVRVCWSSAGGSPATILYAGYAQEGAEIVVKTKGAITPSAGSTLVSTVGFPVASSSHDNSYAEYTQCSPNIAMNGSQRLRIRPIDGQIEKGAIVGSNGNQLATQGFIIESVGELEQGGKKIRRAVRVTKTYPYAVYSFFDYAIYSDKGDVTTN